MSDYSKYVPVTIPYQNARHLNMTVGNALFSGDDDEDDAPVKKKGYTRCDQESFLLQLQHMRLREYTIKAFDHTLAMYDTMTFLLVP